AVDGRSAGAGHRLVDCDRHRLGLHLASRNVEDLPGGDADVREETEFAGAGALAAGDIGRVGQVRHVGRASRGRESTLEAEEARGDGPPRANKNSRSASPAVENQEMANWLFKEEPTHYSYDAFVKDGRAMWSGVKNPVAQRHLHSVKKGDHVFYYHTGDEKSV